MARTAPNAAAEANQGAAGRVHADGNISSGPLSKESRRGPVPETTPLIQSPEESVKIRALALFLAFASVPLSPPVQAQEEDVRAAVAETLEAWTSGRFEAFAGFYHKDARGFFLDGGPLTGGFTVETLEAASAMGFQTELDLEGLEVSVFGEVATSAGYLVGRLILPGGTTVDGTLRYTDTRVLEDGAWKVVQFHFSEQRDPQGGQP
jgi:uncharacterized protein (TIGR02246 family)